jgi:MarR family transcriptional regulator, transcriptional regulator for hemolysin
MATVESVKESCPECLSSDLAWLLSQASFALTREVSAAFDDLGVSPRGYHVLAAAAAGALTQKELADRVGLDKTTMVATVDELESAGLAERRPSKTDRRARVIAVTAGGKRKVAEGLKVVEQVQADVLGSLPAGERRAFISALSRLVGERLAAPVECKRPLRRPRAA